MNGWIDGLDRERRHELGPGHLPGRRRAARSFDIAIVITDGNPTFYGNQRGPGQLHPLPRGRERHLLGQRGQGQGDPDGRRRRRRRRQRLAQQPDLDLGPDRQQRLLPDHRLHGGRRRPAGPRPRATARAPSRSSSRSCRARRPPGSITGAVPAGGWTVRGHDDDERASPSPRPRGTTAAGSGAVSFNLTFPGGTTTAPVTVTETQQAGLHAGAAGRLQRDLHAGSTRTPRVTVTNSGATGFTRDGGHRLPGQLHRLQPRALPGRDDRGRQEVGHQRPELRRGPAALRLRRPRCTIGGTAQGWGVARTGFQQGDTTVLNETVAARGDCSAR